VVLNNSHPEGVPVTAWVVFLVVPLLFVWQGLDLGDAGYYLTIYQNFFSHPEAILYSFPTWLTNLAGASWLTVVPLPGLLAIRIFNALVLAATAAAAYRLLSGVVARGPLLAALTVTLLFSRSFIDSFGYNSLTGLVAVVAVLCLTEGLVRDRRRGLVLAGFLCALNVFVRLPNLLDLALALGIPFWVVVNRLPVSRLVGGAAWMAAGFAAGFGVCVVALVGFGHGALYLQALSVFAQVGTTRGTGHGLADMLKAVPSEAVRGLPALGAFGLWWFLSAFGERRGLTVPRWAGLVPAAALVGVAVLDAGNGGALTGLRDGVVAGVKLITAVVLLTGLAGFLKAPARWRLLCLLGLIVLEATPFGSAVALQNSVFGFWIALPLVLCSASAVSVRGLASASRALSLVLAGFIAVLSLLSTYQDSTDRWRLVHPLTAPSLAGVLTTPERAEAVDGLVRALGAHRGEFRGRTMVCYGGWAPMVYALAGYPPALAYFWAEVPEYSADQLAHDLDQIPLADLPLVVLLDGPFDADPRWPVVGAPEPDDPKRAALDRFTGFRGYRTVWTNQRFTLLLPP